MALTYMQKQEMQALYDSGNYYVENKIVVGDKTFYDDTIISCEITRHLFESGRKLIGNANSGEIDVTLRADGRSFAVRDVIVPYMRMVRVEGNAETPLEWIQKGVFFIDTRELNSDRTIVSFHGYDIIARFDSECTLSSVKNGLGQYVFVRTILNEIASEFGINVPNNPSFGAGDQVYLAVETCTYREILEDIAATHFGNFAINDDGDLVFVASSFSAPSFYLVDENGRYITFGGTRIITRES